VRWQFMGDPSLSNITAWVRKKVPELVGMEEPDLVEFIMGHVRQHASAGECGAAQQKHTPFFGVYLLVRAWGSMNTVRWLCACSVLTMQCMAAVTDVVREA
jgi:hypothetical protein